MFTNKGARTLPGAPLGLADEFRQMELEDQCALEPSGSGGSDERHQASSTSTTANSVFSGDSESGTRQAQLKSRPHPVMRGYSTTTSLRTRHTALSVPREIIVRVILQRSPQGFGLTIEGPNYSTAVKGDDDQGIFVTRVKPGGPAARTGMIEQNMRIIRINGQDFFNETAASAKAAIADQEVVELEMYLPSAWKKMLLQHSSLSGDEILEQPQKQPLQPVLLSKPQLQSIMKQTDRESTDDYDSNESPSPGGLRPLRSPTFAQRAYNSDGEVLMLPPDRQDSRSSVFDVPAMKRSTIVSVDELYEEAIGGGVETDADVSDVSESRALEEQRKHIVLELLDTEKNYMESLRFIVRVYVDKLRRYDPDKIPIFFSNLERIESASYELYTSLHQDHIQENSSGISKCFNRALPAFKSYILYCGHIEFLQRELDFLMHKKTPRGLAELFYEGFREASQASSPCARWALKDLLSLPFHRICKYPLLLERILKKTRPDTAEQRRLKLTLERIRGVVGEINAGKKKYDRLFQIASNMREYAGRPLHRLGEFVREGDLQIREMSSGRRPSRASRASLSGKSAIPKNHGFLFSDVSGQRMTLIVAQVKNVSAGMYRLFKDEFMFICDYYIQMNGGDLYVVKASRVMANDCVVRIGDTFDLAGIDEYFPNAWTVDSKTSLFTLSAESPEERNEWIEIMEREVDKMNGKIDNEEARRSIDELAAGDDWELNRYEISFVERVGHGQLGEIWKGRYGNALEVGIHKIDICPDRNDFMGTFDAFKTLDHENVVKVQGVCSEEEPYLAVTEYVDAGNLRNFLNDGLGATMGLHELITISTQIVSGMEYLASKNIVHGSLRTENVLVGHDNSGAIVAKVTGFGLVRLMSKIMRGPEHDSLLKWNAPEIHEYTDCSVQSDVWSFGISLYEVLTQGRTPFAGMDGKAALEKVRNGYRLPCPAGNSLKFPISNVVAVHSICLKCWDSEPAGRPHFGQISNMLGSIQVASHQVGTILWEALGSAGFIKPLRSINEMVDVCRTTFQKHGSIKDASVVRVKDERYVRSIEEAANLESSLVGIGSYNVAKFYGLSSGPYPLYIVEEFCYHNGTVLSFLRKASSDLPMASTITMASQIAAGMQFLHEQHGIVHGALCCENVAYGRAGRCKISNLMYGRLQNPALNSQYYRWTSPEVLKSGTASASGDVWSFGVVLFELLTMGGIPYEEIEELYTLKERIIAGVQISRPKRAFKGLHQVITSCTILDPGARPSFSMLAETLREPQIINIEEFVVCIQTAWRGYKQRLNFRAIVRTAQERWNEKMRVLSLWCKYAYRLDVSSMSMQEKEELLTDVLNDVARIRIAVYDSTGMPPSVATVVDAYSEAEGNETRCMELLVMRHEGFSLNQPLSRPPPPPGFGDTSSSPPNPSSSPPNPSAAIDLQFTKDWPLERVEEDCKQLFWTLRDYIADPGSKESASEALENFVDDEYVVNFAKYVADLGWNQDEPNLSPEMAQNVCDLLSTLEFF